MPSVNFVLPHWLYWSGLLLFPLIAMYMLARRRANGEESGEGGMQGVSIGIGYFLLVTAGFIGMHRLYLRNLKGLLFIPVFLVLLFANSEQRDNRENISNAKNEIVTAEFLLERAIGERDAGEVGAAEEIVQQQRVLSQGQDALTAAEATRDFWVLLLRVCALAILFGILFDAGRLPSLLRHCRELDRASPIHRPIVSGATVTAGRVRVRNEKTRFAQVVGRVNNFAGTFVAYWSVIAVFVYYYEVIARYVFNSPTNWAHESMFLMFGAQYLIAGGFCMREDAHVRVDVFYMKFKRRTKAMVDVATSVFFFVFLFSLMSAGWTFFRDSFEVREVSFTEWAIQYYPIKFTIALGAVLLLLQGAAKLLSDISALVFDVEDARGT